MFSLLLPRAMNSWCIEQVGAMHANCSVVSHKRLCVMFLGLRRVHFSFSTC